MNSSNPFGRFLDAGRAVLVIMALLAGVAAQAEDIDIFTSGSGSAAVTPTVMILVDNSANWSRAAQQWPDGNTQGEAEMAAMKVVLNAITNPVNIGLAMYTKIGSNYGGYMRFGARDMSVSGNRTALTGILDQIKANINSPTEKVASNDGEAAALYEIYKYYNAGVPFRGAYADNPYADVSGNTSSPSAATAAGEGLISGFAIGSSGNYAPIAATCGRNYVILIANNANGTYPAGAQTYESTNAGAAIAGTSASWTDEWARFLYQTGISVYVIDVYNAQNNAAYSTVLNKAATVGGGKYFQANNQSKIESALRQIFAEIQSVNSTFATASLPISATNRSQSLNQVFIGMFRPDPDGAPRWMGNLKQYQLIKSTASVDLGDVLGRNAINLQTGFVTDCAASFWTSDSASYWSDVPINPVPSSACALFPTVGGITGSRWSDLPDGPTVEKGGVAEILRKGNNPSTTNASPTWTVNRTIWTLASSTTTTLSAFTTATTGLSVTLVNWVRGAEDASATLEKTSNTGTSTRPSIHGDVIHSRPLPVNYGTTTGVTVFYGSNDGMFRAIDAANGRERWAFVAPESYSALQRLHDNSPMVNYPTLPSGITPTPTPKDYFFDGSIGLYQNADNSNVWIFPTLRRGGRYVYGFDVTDPANPTLKWRVGCPNASNDTGCTSGFTAIGQTWSTPNVAFLTGYSSTTPVVIFGAGYDACEDANGSAPTCASRKGNAVFVVNANTGALVKKFDMTGSVVADISLVDTNSDGSVDHAYAVTTTGDIYRMDFSSSGTPLASGAWASGRIAYTTGGGRKFLYAPALLYNSGKMYLALGSGDREHPLATHYPYTTPITNRFYVYLDDLSVAASASMTAIAMDTDATMQNYSADSSCTTPAVTPGSALKGWYMNLARTGEQVNTSALIAAGMVTFNTNRPTPAAGACTSSLGESRGYWVNLLNGAGGIGVANATCGGDRSSIFVGGGLTPSPTLATVLIDGTPTTVVIGAIQRSGGASSGIAPQQVKPSISSRRRIVYWKSNGASD